MFFICISYKMVSDFNVLGSIMKNWIFNYANGTLVINENGSIHEIVPIIQQLILNP